MKFTNNMNEFIEFMDNKKFNYNINKLKLYNKTLDKNKKILEGNSKHTNNDFDHVLENLYNDFDEAYNYYKTQKGIHKSKLFDIQIKNINHVNDIPKSKELFDSIYVSKNAHEVINNESDYSITYKFKIHEREVTIIFITCNENIVFNIDKYNTYMENIYIWFYIASKHASSQCSKKLVVYIYLTNLKRMLPKSSISVIEQENVNGGVSNVCAVNFLSEIVIYRREEWFKVLIHETFHNYGLDFSSSNIGDVKGKFKELFPIKSDMLIFEAYTEFWGEMLNICFICYFASLNSKEDSKNKFMVLTRELIKLEKSYSLLQMVKILNFMGLEYTDLYKKNEISSLKRNNLYKENTNVFPYYILKSILMYFCEDFLIWNNTNNISLLRFNKTNSNITKFYDFIQEKHNNKYFVQDVKKMEKYHLNLLKTNNHRLNTTLRMSVCEVY